MTADVHRLTDANLDPFAHLPPPPRGFSRRAKTKWKELMSEYELSDAYSRSILEQALCAYDDMLEFKKQIRLDGLMVPAKGPGRPARGKDARQAELFEVANDEPLRPHPLLAEVDKSRRSMVAFLVKLHIGVTDGGNPVSVAESPKTRTTGELPPKPSWMGE